MRILAGILLIVAAILNGCAGAGYALGGAVVAGASQVGSEAKKEMDKTAQKEGATRDAAAEKASHEADATLEKGKAAGGALVIFGIFLFVMLGLQIAGAVVLFLQKAKGFAIAVGVLGIVAEVVGIVLTKFGWTNIVGLVGSALCIVAAATYAKAQMQQAPQPLPGGG